MKLAIFLSLLGLASPALAVCQGEAQIIARVSTTQALPGDKCLAKIEAVDFLAANQFCPLGYGDLLGRGVILENTNAQECATKMNTTVSGVVVLQDGALVLER